MPAPAVAVPSIAALERVVERLVGSPGVSAARARQLRWVVGELERAVGREGMPEGAARSVAALLSRESIDAYLRLAEAGELRRKPARNPSSSSDASLRVRWDCLGILGREAGVSVEVPRVPKARPRETVPPVQQRTLYRELSRRAARAPLDQDGIRLLAIVGVVLDTGARVGELCAMTVDDHLHEGTVLRVRRRPQNAAHLPEVVEEVWLRPGTQVALWRWLAERKELVAVPEGGRVRHLWVSLRATTIPNGDGSWRVRPPGMPLQPRGLLRAYERGVDRLNTALAGKPGWSPLPTRLEQLRRAVDTEPLVVEDGGA